MPTTWNPVSGILASTSANWTSGVPSATNGAIFDATSTSNCSWDISTVLSIELRVGYTGNVTLSVDTSVTGTGADILTILSGTLTAHNRLLDVFGQWRQRTPGKFDQNNGAGSALRVREKFDNTSATTGNAFDSNNIIMGPTVGTGGIFEYVNTDFRSRMDLSWVADTTYKFIGRAYIDVVKDIIGGTGTCIYTDNNSQHLITTANYNLVTNRISFQPTAKNRLQLGLGGTQSSYSQNFGGAQIDFSGTTLVSGGLWSNIGTVTAWQNGSSSTYTFNADIECDRLEVGNSGLTTRNGKCVFNKSLYVANTTVVYQSAVLGDNLLNVSNAHSFNTNNLTVQTVGSINLAGTLGVAQVRGNLLLTTGASVSWGTTAFRSIGSAAQSHTFAGFNPYQVEEYKTGGSIAYLDAWTASGNYVIRTLENYNTTFKVSLNFGANALDWARANKTVPSTKRASLDTDTGAGLFNFVIATGFPNTVRNVNPTRMNLTGDTQNADTTSCTIGTGTTTVPPDAAGFALISDPTFNRVRPILLGTGLVLGVGFD